MTRREAPEDWSMAQLRPGSVEFCCACRTRTSSLCDVRNKAQLGLRGLLEPSLALILRTGRK